MKRNTKVYQVVTAILLIAVLLAACAPQATPVPPTATAIPPTATAVPATATTAPAAASTPTAAATAPDPAYYENEPVAVVPAGVPGQPMITAAYNTVIRSGPGTNYVVYGAFLGGATAVATGKSQDGAYWVISVPVAPGGAGWVSAAYAIPSNTENLPVVAAPPVPPTTDMVPPGPSDPQAKALTETYVRTGPGDTYPAYGIVKTGALARVIGKSQDGAWLTVRLNPEVVGNGYGWVATAFVEASNIENVPVVAAPDMPPTVQTTPPPAGTPTATAIDYVNIRSGPGTNYYILGVASPGATGEVSGKSEDGAWWQIKIPTTYVAEGVGWVSKDFVVTANTDSVPVVAAPAAPPTTVPTEPPPTGTCALVSQNPVDGTTFSTSMSVGVTWTLKNTSTTAWDQNKVDLVFQGAINGQRLHQNGDLYDLPQTVEPGATYTVAGSLITPADPGQYGEAWALMQEGKVLCPFWIVINVK